MTADEPLGQRAERLAANRLKDWNDYGEGPDSGTPNKLEYTHDSAEFQRDLTVVLAANADLTARVEAAEKERDEANAEWPEWARKILAMLQGYGRQYEADDYIDIADEVSTWADGVMAACEADIARLANQRDAALARAEAAEAREVRLAALVRRYLNETPLGHQPYMIAHEARAALATEAPA